MDHRMQALWSYDKDQGPQPLGLSKEAQRHYRQKKTPPQNRGTSALVQVASAPNDQEWWPGRAPDLRATAVSEQNPPQNQWPIANASLFWLMVRGTLVGTGLPTTRDTSNNLQISVRTVVCGFSRLILSLFLSASCQLLQESPPQHSVSGLGLAHITQHV